ncbi:hypothetical protein VTO73DRAFT_2373 [Trametes versicolor]
MAAAKNQDRFRIPSIMLPGVCDASFRIYDSPNPCPSASHTPQLRPWSKYEKIIELLLYNDSRFSLFATLRFHSSFRVSMYSLSRCFTL